MDREIILELVSKKIDTKDTEAMEILKCIDEAKLEIEVAREMFQFVSDPRLVEAAIYKEDSAIKRYEYLIALAKKREMGKCVE